jgi:hypothetical protein
LPSAAAGKIVSAAATEKRPPVTALSAVSNLSACRAPSL